MKRSIFLTLCLAFFADSVAYSIVAPFLPVYIGGELGIQTLTQLPISLMLSTYGLGALLSTPAWMFACVRFSSQVGFCLSAFTLFISSLPPALPFLSMNVVVLLILRALQGASSMGTWMTGLYFLGRSVPTDQVGGAFGKVLSMMSLGILIGPAFGGWMYEVQGINLPYAVVSFLAVVYGTMMWFSMEEPKATENDFGITWDFSIFKDIQVLSVAGVILIGSQTICAIDAAVPNYMTNTLHVAPSIIGLVLMWAAIATAIGAPVAGWVSDKVGPLSVLYVLHIICAAVLPLMALSSLFASNKTVAVIIQIVACMLAGASTAALVTPCYPRWLRLLQRKSGPAQAAIQASLAQNIMFTLGTIIGPIIASVVVIEASFFYTMVVFSIILLVYCAILKFINRNEGQESEHPSPEPVDREEYEPLADEEEEEEDLEHL